MAKGWGGARKGAGRKRTAQTRKAPNEASGYIRTTVGPKPGKRSRKHRDVVSAKPGQDVHHKGARSDNTRSNLKAMAKGKHSSIHPGRKRKK